MGWLIADPSLRNQGRARYAMIEPGEMRGTRGHRKVRDQDGQSRKIDLRKKDKRLILLRQMPIGVTLAFTAVVMMLVFFVLPKGDANAIVIALNEPLAEIWAAMTMASGIMVLAGVWQLSPRLEAAGLVMLSGTIGVDVFTIINVRGIESMFGAWPIMGCFIGFGIRAWMVVRNNSKPKGE